jgi:hypothetical protein
MKSIKAMCIVSILGLSAFACSSDDPPANVSCQLGTTMCAVGPGSASDCTGAQGTVVSSCPANPLLTCPVTSGGRTATMYFYDQATVDALKTQNPTDPCAAFASSG